MKRTGATARSTRLSRSRSATIAVVGAAALLLAACGDSGDDQDEGGDGWEPDGTVTVLVTSQPGGGSDITGRDFAATLPKIRPGVEVQVENYDTIPGFIEGVARDGDPLTVLTAAHGGAIQSPLEEDLPYTWEDFARYAIYAEDPAVLVTAADSEFQTFEDVVAAAKERDVTIGWVLTTGPDAIETLTIEEAMDIDLKQVVFDGGGEQLTATLAGDVDVSLIEPGSLIDYIKTGEVRPLLSMHSERIDAEGFADTPTAAEAGITAEDFNQWRGFFGPPGLTDEQVDWWVETMEMWVETEEFQKYIDDNLLVPTFVTGADLDEYMEGAEATTEEIIAQAGS